MSSITHAEPAVDPRRYFEATGERRGTRAEQPPVCLYLEVTNRCNLLCETCPRTFEELEPPADLSWELFTKIVDQMPKLARAVLHGVGEPMMVRELPKMISYLKARDTYVLFNSNGSLLTERKGRELIACGLDELRISLDAADAETFKLVRGRDFFDRIVRNVRRFVALQTELGATKPRVSLWLTGLKETLSQVPAFVRLGHEMGVKEVYLQRLVFPPDGMGMARAESALFEKVEAEEQAILRAAERLAEELGIVFSASGATDPENSLGRQADDQPWSLCRRPWSLMYVTAHGRILPCCIAPFAARGYENFTLGDATQHTLREIWNDKPYRDFRHALLSDQPPETCVGCGLRWSL
jgi:MoaA/NifB/PqqE/SkfB family radical SAM enzyme